jgi:hypothetical protein
VKTVTAKITKTIVVSKTQKIEVPEDFSDEQLKNFIEDIIYCNNSEWEQLEVKSIETTWQKV